MSLLPLLLLAAGLALDLATPRDVSAAACFAAAPIVAAPLLSLRGTMLVGLTACIADLAVLAYYGMLSNWGALSDWASVATMAALAVFLNRRMYRREMRLRSMSGIAAAVQRALLPQPLSHIGALRIAARYEAAQSDAQLGGDLYAVQDTPYGVRCLIGDVRGKGMGAVEVVTVVLGAFREGAQREPTLTGLAQWIEQTVLREAAQRAGPDQVEEFTTAVLVEIPQPADRLRLVNRGHPAPLLLLDGAVRPLHPSRPALPLGLGPLGAPWGPRPAPSTPSNSPQEPACCYTQTGSQKPGIRAERSTTPPTISPASAPAARTSSSPHSSKTSTSTPANTPPTTWPCSPSPTPLRPRASHENAAARRLRNAHRPGTPVHGSGGLRRPEVLGQRSP